MTYLDSIGICYETREYDFARKGAEYAAEALEWPAEAMIKSIVVRGEREFHFCLMPGTREISLRKAASVFGEKKVTMAEPADAERVTGYQVGGISPFGAKKKLPVAVDQSLSTFERIAINAGARGIILFMRYADLIDALAGRNIQMSEPPIVADLRAE